MAARELPRSKVIVSPLLPQADVPHHIIQGINMEVSPGCALLPSMHLAQHRHIRLCHMYDQLHLNKEGTKLFAKSLKDTALDRELTNPPTLRPGALPATSEPAGAPSPQATTPQPPSAAQVELPVNRSGARGPHCPHATHSPRSICVPARKPCQHGADRHKTALNPDLHQANELTDTITCTPPN
ncbi:UNVERIFIED_CONTAM: hypothetical protein FKN15_072776 [Acipenser sinensis]